jgi:hypothetical protein
MTTWTSSELDKIGSTEELKITSLQNDGALRKPTIIWVVRVKDELYVRSTNGRTTTWFRDIQERYEGHIRAGGVDKDVTSVEEIDDHINDQVDAAYNTKYGRYGSITSQMTSSEPRATTIKLVPR